MIERCSGHGGTFGVLKPTFEVAMKVGKPAARTANTQGNAHVVSDCPLAAKHLKQGMRALDETASPSEIAHPVELMAKPTAGGVTMMSAAERKITRSDLIDLTRYGKERAERRKAMLPVKRLRRVEVGPHATFYFECYDTMWLQVHEMLYIERGGEEQIADELRAYNPLIPQKGELVATVMFEIVDPDQRARILRQLTNIEETAFLDVSGERIKASFETDVDRTAEDGKTSSVHF